LYPGEKTTVGKRGYELLKGIDFVNVAKEAFQIRGFTPADSSTYPS
jgi:hypothetical protein